MSPGLIIPYIYSSLPSFLFRVLRGQLGKWVAFAAVVLRLYFPKHFPDRLETPSALILLIVVAPGVFSGFLRNSWMGVVICLVIACYLLYKHIKEMGGFDNCFKKPNLANTIGIIILFVYPAFVLVIDFM